VACDYEAAELHTLAQVCIDLFEHSKLAEALNEGTDVHAWVGAQLLGVDYPGMMQLIEAGDTQAKDMRQLAKAANFGFPGGCSAKRFVGIAHAYGVDIDIRDASKLRALWFSTWPEMRDYFDHVSKCDNGDGFFWVKQLRVERVRGRCTYTSACNSYFQGLAADGAKAALWEITRRQHTEPDSALYGTKCVNFVHDEILVECHEEICNAVAVEMQEVMTEQFNAFVPDVPTLAEPVVMRYWSKNAKPVTDEAGRLVPWNK
jgi:DNA polymerase-1